MDSKLAELLGSTMKFNYVCGAVTPIANCHDTGWRTMQCALCTQNLGNLVDVHLGSGAVMTYGHGEALIMPAGIRHRIRLRPGGESVSRWAHFEFSVFETVDALSFYELPKIFSGSVAEKMGRLCEALSNENEKPSMLCLCRIKELGFSLAETALENSEQVSGFRERCESYRRLAPAFRSSERFSRGEISLEEMAKLCNLSVSRFSAIFRAATGESPVRYQTQARLQKARSMLLSGDSMVAEIAEAFGYKDQFHFSKAFKLQFGLSPLQYREQAKARLKARSF